MRYSANSFRAGGGGGGGGQGKKSNYLGEYDRGCEGGYKDFIDQSSRDPT